MYPASSDGFQRARVRFDNAPTPLSKANGGRLSQSVQDVRSRRVGAYPGPSEQIEYCVPRWLRYADSRDGLGGMPDRSPAHICGGPPKYLRQKSLNAIPGFRAAVHDERHEKIDSRSSQNGLIWINLQSHSKIQKRPTGWKGARTTKKRPRPKSGPPVIAGNWL